MPPAESPVLNGPPTSEGKKPSEVLNQKQIPASEVFEFYRNFEDCDTSGRFAGDEKPTFM